MVATSEPPADDATRVLVFAPLGRNADVLCRTLTGSGLKCSPCADGAGLAAGVREGAGAMLLTDEGLTPAAVTALAEALRAQLPWSDLPVLLLAGEQWHAPGGTRVVADLRAAGNLTVLERPARALSLVTAVQAALRARRRQYEIRDLLREEAARAADIEHARDELGERVAERTADLERANAALTELLRRVVTAQEDERRRVSRELHDGLGQELTALILGLKALEAVAPADATIRARLRALAETVHRVTKEAHDLAVELRPTVLDDIGLAAALSSYVARWSERTGVAATFRALGLEGRRLPPEVETAVYRVVQEAMNNVAKHAAARDVGVIVVRHCDGLIALIEDDGCGFDPERVESESGRPSLGLLGMRERVGLVGGTLVVESGEGERTTVRARIPLPHPTEDAGQGGSR